MTSDTVLTHEDQLIRDDQQRPTRHFDVVQSEEEEDEQEEEEENRITSDEDNSPPIVDTFEDKSLNKLYDDWFALDVELRTFEPKHKEYVSRLDDVESLKTKYRTEFDKYKKKLTELQKDLQKLKKSYAKKGEWRMFIGLMKFISCRRQTTNEAETYEFVIKFKKFSINNESRKTEFIFIDVNYSEFFSISR